MIVYLAGPMTGLPEWNRPAFHAAAQAWRVRHHVVLNPAENFGGDERIPYADYIRASIRQVLAVQAIALLPGWQESRGARVEVHLALTLGLKFFDAETFEPITIEIVQLGLEIATAEAGV